MLLEGSDNYGCKLRRHQVVSSQLKDARSIGMRKREHRPDVEVVREDDVVAGEGINPVGRLVHVDDELESHCVASSTSRSSSRQAA